VTSQTFASLDIVPFWSRTNDSIVQLVDYIPDDKLNWSPKPELWNFRAILLHIASARDIWLSRDVRDGADAPNVARTVRTKADIQDAYLRTWKRLVPFLRDVRKLDATYTTPWETASGHWIAFHALEHDIHHRADIFHYLALLGIEHPEVGTP
jgi:uncharacterized damage-inducible protein DinB